MPNAVPREAIFWEDAGLTYLVTNWRERFIDRARPVLIRLSDTHLRVYRELRGRGRSEKSIYYVLFKKTLVWVARGSAAAAAKRAAARDAPAMAARRGWRDAGWPGWTISMAVHLLLLTALCGVLSSLRPPELPVRPLRTVAQPVRPPAPAPRAPEPAQPLAIDLPPQDESVAAEVQLIEPSDPQMETEVEPRAPAVAVETSDLDLGGSGAFMALGAGGGAAGMFASRGAGGRQRAITRFGGSRASEDAVEAALRWLKKHQSQDGSWDIGHYHENCPDRVKCEPGPRYEGVARRNMGCAMTGFALLCFLGAGFDHETPSRYRGVVGKGLAWLRSAQHDGTFGGTNYEHAIATMALAEAFAMTGDRALKRPAQLGVDGIVKRQNRAAVNAKDPDTGVSYRPGLGWDYGAATGRSDTSVTGWNVMALKSAIAAGLDVGHAYDGCKLWLDTAWKATNPGWASLDPYEGSSRFPYTYDTASGQIAISPTPADHLDLAGVGAACAAFLGRHAGDALLETMANYVVANQTPTHYPCNLYYAYYGTLALFQVGGDRWKVWNSQVRDLLVGAQRRSADCFDGSWDADPSSNGRIMSTALCCLSLEVYYRYRQVAAAER